jgi:hypothetical protein
MPAIPPRTTGSTASERHVAADPTSTEVSATPAVAVPSDQTRGRATAASRASRLPSQDRRSARSVLKRNSANTSQMKAAPNAASPGRTSCRWAAKAPGAVTASPMVAAGSSAVPTTTAAGGRTSRIARTPATIPSERKSRRAGEWSRPAMPAIGTDESAAIATSSSASAPKASAAAGPSTAQARAAAATVTSRGRVSRDLAIAPWSAPDLRRCCGRPARRPGGPGRFPESGDTASPLPWTDAVGAGCRRGV